MILDCDVHHNQRHIDQILVHLREPYRTEVARYGFRALAPGIRYEEGGQRWDIPTGTGGDPDLVRTHHLERYDVAYAFLSGYTGPFAGIPDADYTDALCSAFNDFTAEEWLARDDRFRAGIYVPLQDPQLAAREIERLGDHPGFVAVCFAATAQRIPFGQRYYWPIYEAAARHNLPIHFHPSTTSVIANYASTAAGPASTYLEVHAGLPQFYQAYLISFIYEGVFERFPGLRIALVEGGFGWVPHVLWRMDKEFKALRQQAPYLKRLPSEYMKDHVRLATQPIEEPKRPEHLLQMLTMIHETCGSEEILMFASDFPHFDFDEPSVLPRGLSETTRRKILYDNAAALFNLPSFAEETKRRESESRVPVPVGAA